LLKKDSQLTLDLHMTQLRKIYSQPAEEASHIPTPKKAAEIAFTGMLLRYCRNHVHAPLPKWRETNIRKLLDAYDTYSQKEIPDKGQAWTRQAREMAFTLEAKEDEIFTNAQKWDTIHARYTTLQAVKDTRELGEFYLDLLYKRTGLTPERVKEMKEAIPKWETSTKVLNQEQRFAAEAVYSRLLLQNCKKVSKELAKNQGKRYPDTDIVLEGIEELLKAHVRVQQNCGGKSLREQDYDCRAKEMIPVLEYGKNKIFDKAQLWDSKDMRAKVRAAANDFRKLEDKNLLQELTGISPKMIQKAKKRGQLEFLITSVFAVGNELISHIPGVAAVIPQINVQEYLPHDPWIVGGATLLLYGSLAGILIRNSFLNADFLIRTGVSLDPWSKVEYDYAVDNERREAVKGALKYHLAWELPFYGVALYIGSKHGWQAGLAYFNIASVAGLTKNILLNGGLETFRWAYDEMKRKK